MFLQLFFSRFLIWSLAFYRRLILEFSICPYFCNFNYKLLDHIRRWPHTFWWLATSQPVITDYRCRTNVFLLPKCLSSVKNVRREITSRNPDSDGAKLPFIRVSFCLWYWQQEVPLSVEHLKIRQYKYSQEKLFVTAIL